jgi:hypothetical protein
MSLLRTVVVVSLAWSAACATTAHPGGAAPVVSTRQQAGRCRDAAKVAAIEVYPVGLNPQRRFRAVGTVETGRQGSTLERAGRLQAQACELGADAVIGWSEEDLGTGLATAFEDGSTVVSTRNQDRSVAASGIAVVYTDRARSLD